MLNVRYHNDEYISPPPPPSPPPTHVFTNAYRNFKKNSDEFMLPYATSAFGRTLWVLFLLVGVCVTTPTLLFSDCEAPGLILFVYLVVSLGVGVVSILVEFQIAKASTYGTIIGKYYCHKKKKTKV